MNHSSLQSLIVLENWEGLVLEEMITSFGFERNLQVWQYDKDI